MSDMFDLETYLWNYITSFWHMFLDSLQELVIFLVDKLPDGVGSDALFVMPTPTQFTVDHDIMSTFVNFVCWLFPVQFYVGLMTAFGTFLAVYFVVAPLLRWLKVIPS